MSKEIEILPPADDREVANQGVANKVHEYIQNNPTASNKQIANAVGIGDDRVAVANIKAIRGSNYYQGLVEQQKEISARYASDEDIYRKLLHIAKNGKSEIAQINAARELFNAHKMNTAETLIQIYNDKRTMHMGMSINPKEWDVRNVNGQPVPIHLPTAEAIRNEGELKMNPACIRSGCVYDRDSADMQTMFDAEAPSAASDNSN